MGTRRGHIRKLQSNATTWVRPHALDRASDGPKRRLTWRNGYAYVSGSQAYRIKCRGCGQLVFFYRNQAGSRVFFDSLGAPWPKHGCTAWADRMQTVPITKATPVTKQNKPVAPNAPARSRAPVADPDAIGQAEAAFRKMERKRRLEAERHKELASEEMNRREKALRDNRDVWMQQGKPVNGRQKSVIVVRKVKSAKISGKT